MYSSPSSFSLFSHFLQYWPPPPHSSAPPEVGFYKSTFSLSESIVKRAVNKAVSANPVITAGLIRMHFHDCFVRVCDGSVLLKSTPANSPANKPNLRGFEIIDKAKAQIEAVCPQTVSCADILAFAARDSSQKLGHINYDVPSGRRDGRVSVMDQVQGNLPPPSLNSQQLIDNFLRKGLSVANNGGAEDTRVVLDASTPNRLDKKYYVEQKNHRGLLTSDQTLVESESTRKMIQRNAKDGGNWVHKFAKAMVRMGSIEVPTGSEGEIRKTCSVVI